MNYYIIPKNNINMNFQLSLGNYNYNHISHSVNEHLVEVLKQLNTYNINLLDIKQIINPLEFVHNIVPGTQLSVSKLKTTSNILFELMELFHICGLVDFFSDISTINILNFTSNFDAVNELINIIREDYNDNITNEIFNFSKIIEKYYCNSIIQKFNVIIIEFEEDEYINNRQYILNMIIVVYLILKLQENNGICIIKIGNVSNKVILDIVYILSTLYHKTYLIKPNICNISSVNRYLICKQFSNNYDNLLIDFEKKILTNINNMDNNINNNIINYETSKCIIKSIISNNIPNYFINKIEEINAIIGQQQIESIDQILSILRSKNKDDKIEVLKRNHIQKCIQWCEKNQIPHNKFTDKINIFLNSKKE